MKFKHTHTAKKRIGSLELVIAKKGDKLFCKDTGDGILSIAGVKDSRDAHVKWHKPAHPFYVNASYIVPNKEDAPEEEVNAASKKRQNFYYHPKGCDNNGNGGPDAHDPGWIMVSAHTAEEAVSKLPPAAQKKVMKAVEKYRSDAKWWEDLADASIEQAMEDTCGMGWNCTFMDQDNWDDFLTG